MIDRRTLIGAAALLPFARPAPGQAPAARVLKNSISLDGNRVWIAARIKEQGPYFFVVDTGANVSLLDDKLAKQLRLSAVGQSRLRGVGGISDYAYYDAGTVSFASGLKIPNMLFAGTGAQLGKDAVGSFGAQLFTDWDSDLDFVAGEWRAYPDGRPSFDDRRKLSSRFKGDERLGYRIYADATIDSFAGEFLVDTGAPLAVTIEGAAARRSGYWDDSRPYAPMAGRGIGRGTVPRRMVRATTMKLGPMTLHKPLVSVAAPGTPGHDADGFVGLRLLERLHLTTQAKTQSLWIAPNGRPARPDSYPMSGLWFDRAGDRIVVGDVGPGSPGANAGIKKGDEITGIAWQPLLTAVNGPAGRDVSFGVKSGGTTRNVTLKLVDYL